MIKTALRSALIGASLATANLATSQAAFAQAAAPTAIVVINVQRIVSESAAGQDIKRQVDAMLAPINDSEKGTQDQLVKERDSLVKLRDTIDANAFEARVRDFQTRAARFEQEANARRQPIAEATNRANQTLETAIAGIVRKLGAERNAALVLAGNPTMFYVAPAVDLTNVVIQRLNAQLARVPVTMTPAAPAAQPR
jgi:Skp family chaperone for outer membrane proteins